MSERLPRPEVSRFPRLELDPRWVREISTDTGFTRIFKAGGTHPSQWHDFRSFGPLDARFDPHPEPIGSHSQHSVMYTTLETLGYSDEADDPAYSALAACLLEVFQRHRIIRRSEGAATLAIFTTTRPLRLLDLSDSDWVTVAGGNAAITSGDHSRSRVWAQAIHETYSDLDGIVAASSVISTARTVALWGRAASAIPRHPLALIRLDREELTGVIDVIAERYGYLLL